MTVKFSMALRQARAIAIRSAIDTGVLPSATINFYTGTIPTVAGAAPTGILLGTVTLATTSGSVTNGVLTFGAIADDISADASGLVGFARILGDGGVFVMDVTVGAGQPITMPNNNYNIVAGGVLKFNSLIISEGNA